MTSLTAEIKFGTPLHTRLLKAIRARHDLSDSKMRDQHAKWKKDEDQFLAFMPEKAVDATKRVKRDNAGVPDYTTIVVPYSYAILMTAHTYWTTVFLSRNPVMQYTGRHGESQQRIQALEALIAYQVEVGEMLVPFYIWLLDMGKYGIGIVGDEWVAEESRISEIVEEQESFLGISIGKAKKVKRTRTVQGYQGNRIFNVRPYDWFPDPRIAIHKFQKGEFCGVRVTLGWNAIVDRAAQGFYVNLDELKKTKQLNTDSNQGSTAIEIPDINELYMTDSDLADTSPKELFEYTIDLIPAAWGLGKSKLAEKWVFTVDSSFRVIIGASPLGFLHNKFPFQIMEYEPEGYALFNRSLPRIVEPLQNTIDWLINSHFYNVRAALNNQVVVDPSRTVMKDWLNPLPGGIIRLKARAYGTDPRGTYSQVQIVDLTSNHLSDIQKIMDLGARVHGVTDQIMGLLAPSGRRSATEVRTSSSFGVNRLKTISEFNGALGFAPLSQMLVQNSQQMYDAEMQFKLVGDLMLEAGPTFVDVNPEMIQGFYDYVPVDGNLPIDRFAQANLWREMFNQMRQTPEIAAKYDIGRIFAWVAQLAGLKNINQFKVQVQPDEQVAAEAQAGNIVEIGGREGDGRGGGDGTSRSSGSDRDLSRVPDPGQLSGMGTTG